MDTRYRHSIFVGQAGVYAVAEKLCLNGMVPLFPGVDTGVDLMLVNGTRIQVKTASLHRTTKQFPAGVYMFNVTPDGGARTGKRKKLTDYHKCCDFIIFVCLTERRFFIVPAKQVTGAFWLEARGHNEALRLIGKSGRNRVVPSNKSKIVKYEDAWHLLDVDSTIESLEQAEDVESAEGAKL